MKLLYTITLLLVVHTLNAQQTITSVNSGLATNPFNWDCTCIPQFNDNIIINHSITLDSDWVVNNGGSVTVGANGSLIKDAQTRTVLVDDNNSQFTNQGTTELTNIVFLKNSSGVNSSNLIITNGFYIDTLATFNNQGTLNNVDSTLSMGTFINSGSFLNGSFWTGGLFENTGYVQKDSLLNTGIVNSSSGSISAYDFATTGEYNLTGSSYMIITNNFYNAGHINVANGRDIRVTNDFFSGDSTFSTANITNNGLIEIGNDFLNIDTLQGSGVFCIGGASTNTGRVLGTLDICSNTTSNLFNLNTGQIDATVTNCSSGCTVSTSEVLNKLDMTVYPNPFQDIIFIQNEDLEINTIEIYNSYGQVIWSKNGGDLSKFDLSFLNNGVYLLRIQTENNSSVQRIIKK